MAPSNACLFCHAPFPPLTGGNISSHPVCPACGAPQPIAPSDDYFSLFGVARGFRQDLAELERRFYAISRELHPDRFAAGTDRKWKTISVERMSAVNRAYQTLTKPDRLREYLLTLEGVVNPAESGSAKKAAIPAELAEEWFELQDAVMENPPEAVKKLGEFESGLTTRIKDLAAKVRTFEDEYDRGAEADARAELLRKIEKLTLDGQYLRSMERDLFKLKGRLGL